MIHYSLFNFLFCSFYEQFKAWKLCRETKTSWHFLTKMLINRTNLEESHSDVNQLIESWFIQIKASTDVPINKPLIHSFSQLTFTECLLYAKH